MSPIIRVVLLPTLAATPAVASVTRGNFDRPPYHDGKPKGAMRPSAHVTVTFRAEPASLDPTPDRSPALAAALDSLREEMGASAALAAGVALSAARAGDSAAGSRARRALMRSPAACLALPRRQAG